MEPIVVERIYNAPVSTVWDAITDNDKMKQWYFQIADFKPVVGFEFSFEGGPPEQTYIHLCKVTEVVPGKKISYSWRYKGYKGVSLVTFELFDEEDKTRLKLTHNGLETFPDKPDFARSSFEQGWNHIIGTSLKKYLETNNS